MLEYKVLLISLIWMCSSFISRAQQSCTDDVTYIAAQLRVNYTVLSNPRDEGPNVFNASIQLYNDGTQRINAGSWAIYISHIRLIEPRLIGQRYFPIGPDGKIFDDVKMKIEFINGDLYKLTPLQDFPGIPPGGSIDIRFQGSDWQVSKTDVMPNWYVSSDNTNISPQIIASTAGESLDFVSDFVTPDQWKRVPSDNYDPYTPEVRLDIDGVPDAGTANHQVIPTPLEMNIDWTKRLNVLSHGWVIVENAALVKEIGFLSGKTGLAVVQESDTPCNRYIRLENTTGNTPFRENESYEISISHTQQNIHIKGQTPAGVFYGIQTLLSLLDSTEWPGEVGDGTVKDNPRFGHRGMHVDVGRNFHTVSDLKRLMDVMTQYKLNVLHFHLTDDEGWRFEIPEIPELTEIGGRRCHDLTETRCIIPLLGSGPTLSNYGSGYYTVDQYRDLLRYASDRHIQVIPEFDMPGHSHAAIKSMEARYFHYNNSNMTKAEEFLLRDLNDPSEYVSVQYYIDNAINPCLESTYHFITVLLQAVIDMHADIQPLEIFHLGGDEAPPDAYLNSTSCAPFFANGTDLKHYFVLRTSEIAANAGVDLAMWEDGFYETGHVMNRTEFRPQNMYTNVWSNVWEWGNGGRAYEFANNNYKVVLSHATHLYFDFPVEPDPLERGYYWGSRIVPMKKTFSYLPDSLYKNIDVDVNRMGYDQSSEDVCSIHACPALLESHRPNIIGMQGQIWSETIRTSEQFDYNVMPRILAVAERSWHKASWEDEEDIGTLKAQRDEDWNRFANTLGHKELRRLDKLGAKYRVPIAGARVNKDTGVLEWTSGLPGLPARYTTDPDAKNWTDLNPLVPVIVWDKPVHIKIGSADSSRFSRSVQPEPVENPNVSSASIIKESIIAIISALLFTLI